VDSSRLAGGSTLVKPPTWKDAIQHIVLGLKRDFSLDDVVAHNGALQKMFPNNRFVDAKIRQSLQVLRDQGLLQFVSPGRYRRNDIAPVFSPIIDMSVAAEFFSQSQVARVALETWASFNLYCVNCESDALDQLRDNTPVADFQCFVCDKTYQLKGKNGRFGEILAGAAYEPTITAVREGRMPEYILVEYDSRFRTVVFVDAVPGKSITEDRVIPRKPLSETARRAGWVGCNIRIDGLASVRQVAPAGVDRTLVRTEWKLLEVAGDARKP
jgi:hypothetical protein